MEKLRCPECDMEIEKGIKECPNCGCLLDEDYASFKRKEQKAFKWAKYGVGVSVVIVILTVLILHMTGNRNQTIRSEEIINELQENELFFTQESSDDISDGYTNINFEEDGDCRVSSHWNNSWGDYSNEAGDAEYSVEYDFWGKEYLNLNIEWNDGDRTTWKLPIGRNKKNHIIALDKNKKEETAFIISDLEDENAEDIVIFYKNSENIGYVIVIILLALTFSGILIANIFATKNSYKTLVKNKELKEKQDRINKEKEALSVEWDKTMESLGYSSKEYVYLKNRNYLWVANAKLYEAENKDSYINRYLGKTDLIHELSYNEIPVSDIQYYSKEGDVQYTTKISGGGGGGSSISGAVVGGLIAGETGAVIGSRQKVQEVTSETVKHDSRRTLIRYYKDKQINVISYVGFEVYDYLLKKIPEKDLLTIQLEKKPVVREKQSSDSIKDKLETIKQLYENDLITKEEYEQKRNEILSKI